MLRKNKPLFIALVSVLTLILAVSSFLLIWFYADSYEDFEDFNKEFSIEHVLDDGAVPQGLGNYGGNYFISAYMADDSASRIYVVNSSYESIGYVTLRLPAKEGQAEGDLYTGHAGGIAVNNQHVWVGSGKTIYVMNRSEILTQAKSNGEVQINRTFKVDCSASFLYYNSNTLYVGEFYMPGDDYPTKESHHVTTPAGEKQNAVFYAFKTNTNNTSGLEDLTPEHAVSIPEKIQGMAIVGNHLVLSQSWSIFKSHMLVYEKSYTNNQIGTLDVIPGSSETTKSIPLYALDSNNQVNDYAIPAMSEGLCVSNNKVFVLFESACVKYEFVNREKLYHVYSFVPEAEVKDEGQDN